MSLTTTHPPRGRFRRRLTSLAATAALSVAGMAALSAPADAAPSGVTTAYVADQYGGTVSAVDTATGSVTATIPVGGFPDALAVNPSGTTAYVAVAITNVVSVIDTATHTVTTSIPVGSNPSAIVLNPAGTLAYVANEGGHTVSVIDTGSDTVVATVPAASGFMLSMAIDPAGTHVYIGSFGPSALTVIDTGTDTVVATVPVVGNGYAVTVNPAGTTAYVGTAAANTITKVDTATDTVTGTVADADVTSLAFTPDGSKLYAVSPQGKDVTVIDPATDTITATISGGFAIPGKVAVDSTGSTAFVTDVGSGNGSTPGALDAIDVATNTLSTIVPSITGGPDALAVHTVPPPTVTAVSPSHGPEAGGTTVTITGTGLTGATITFGTGHPATGVACTATSCTATAPAEADGTVDVQATTADGTSATGSADRYTYDEPAPTVTGISPAFGPLAGGTTVTITGTDFTGATAVAFGGTPASSFTVTSDTSITATAPAEGYGTVDVTVTTAAGTSTARAADHFTYVNEIAKVTAEGRLDTGGGRDAEFGFSARATQAGGPIKSHLTYENQTAGVKIGHATLTVLYLTNATTAHAEGTATCTVGGTSSPCTVAVNAVDNGDPAEHDDDSLHPDTFTLAYTIGTSTTTVGGTIEDGHVEIAPETRGTSGTTGAARTAATAGLLNANPVAGAFTGGFNASLLGITLTGGHCATAALVYTDGTASGGQSCLLLGLAGINIDLNLNATNGTLSGSTATLTGTATVVVAGLLPVQLPAIATTTATGLQLTVAGLTLPTLPIGAGAIEIG